MNLQKYLVPLLLLALLTFLLALGWGTNKFLKTSAAVLLSSAKKVELLVNNSNWTEAEKAFQQVEKKWNRICQYWPLLIHHQEMDRIEECLSKLKSYLQHQDNSNTLAEIYTLINYIKHIPENKTLNLQNIF